ncbi:MAG: hypothetical protein NC816_06165 [Candidatus Omnitrophica bacterium]|nr:hypothetical protein [Candidatus Omnitrophota bacterium]
MGEDKKYAKVLEEFLKLKIDYIEVEKEKAIETIPEVIKILKTFDPAIFNDIVVYLGLKFIKKKNNGKFVLTEDGIENTRPDLVNIF